jgi:regulator of protease activity HflC (stomatin/prohibitin superfamily)
MQLMLTRRSLLATMILGLVGVSGLVVLLRSLAMVPAGHIGIIDQFGQVSDQTLTPGIHLKNPLAKVVLLSTQTQELKETTETASQDGLVITADVSLLYRLDAAKAKQLYQTVGRNYAEVVVVPQFRAAIRNTTARYPAQLLYTSKREAAGQELQQALSQPLGDRGLVVETTLLRNIILPEAVQASVQAKLQAEQDSQRMEFVLQKEKKEAERKRIEAQGVADSQRIVGQGLTDKVLQFRQIEATEKLAQSQNSKVVIVGGGDSAPNLMLQP